jgi:hypothetical protein
MARVKICQTHATQSDLWLDAMDSIGNAERSMLRGAGGLRFLATGFLAAVFLARGFLAAAFFAEAFLAGLVARFGVRVATLQVYQNSSKAVPRQDPVYWISLSSEGAHV